MGFFKWLKGKKASWHHIKIGAFQDRTYHNDKTDVTVTRFQHKMSKNAFAYSIIINKDDISHEVSGLTLEQATELQDAMLKVF